jgi:hypothetical protein
VEASFLKRRLIPGVLDLFEVSDPNEIRELANLDVIDRQWETRTCPVDWFILKRSLSVLSFRGRRFPTMKPRECPSRARAQNELWHRLNAQIEGVKSGPPSLAALTEWIKGTGSDEEIGLHAQQLLGRLFQHDFTATQRSWDAALVLVAAPHCDDPAKLMWWFLTGKVRHAKRVLAELVDEDLSAVNAIGIAVHNLVKSLRQMRSLYGDLHTRTTLSPAAAAQECLRAPVSVYRQAKAHGTLAGTTFSKNSLFALNIGAASQLPGGRHLIFMDETWSRCPAAAWIPALLEGVWRRASLGK